MNTELLNLMAKYMEKQEILSRLTEAEQLHGYSYSEIHTIAAIKEQKDPNVTSLAAAMNVTRGAVSKITKKLLAQGLIETYQKDGNKQKIYFRLTAKGLPLYEEHDRRHQLWLQRDDAFLQKYSKEDIERMVQFMKDFNQYLEEQIYQLGGKQNEN